MQPLDRLLRPRTVAVIGGGAWSASAVEQNVEIGFPGEIWPVHPTRETIGGKPVYRSIDDLPAAPDAAFIAVNREATIEVVAALADRGAGGAICFASGFREAENESAGGADLQNRLLDAAGTMRIVGPNCYGIVNYLDRVALWPDFHGGRPLARGVAIVAQSSNIAINLTMQRRGLPIAYMATVGNQAQTGLSEIGAALLADDRVTALGLYIEGIDDIAALEDLASRARRGGKPVVALKIGRSEHAQGATLTHTASLTGSEAGAVALLDRLGIGQVHTLTAFLETLKLLHVAGPLRSDRIACLSCSGGEASLMADLVHGRNLTFPPLNDRQKSGLRGALGPKVALANPLDYHTYIWRNETALTDTFTAMMDPDELAFGSVVLDFPRGGEDAEPWLQVVRAVKATRTKRGVPMGIMASLPENMPEAMAEALVADGLVPFCGMTEAVEALEVAAWLGRPRPPPLPVLSPGRRDAAGDIPARALSEAEAKAGLAAHGLSVPKAVRAADPEAAARAAETLGFPVVLKGEGIAHKTEAGAVVLGLETPAAVTKAAAAMPATRFLVEEMVSTGVAELLVGVTRDPAHGYLMTLAAGGVLAELVQDRVSMLLPVTAEDVLSALRRLGIQRLLAGYRGRPAADQDAIVAAVLALQSYATASAPDLIEAEVNPLICCPDRAVAADALVQLGGKDDR
ncbi:MAG: acetate--CoA ligase family protein [Alphaproteobacteria bacterium]|nr:acetate--CoA ligase family protein [Alphaproteobacteria bacterium]